jgi:8-oxo-dGTP pyrophosphatase MutT (NUDIX family)
MKDFSFGIVPILVRDGHHEFLLVHQQADYWGFPKGHANSGETAQEAALRELCEETGLSDCVLADDFKHTHTYTFERNGETITKEAHFFLGSTNTRLINVDGEEISEYAWLPYEEALKKLTYQEARDTLTAAEAYIQKHIHKR